MTIIWCLVSDIQTEWHRQNFWSTWAIFCTFTPLTTWKIKILKTWKNPVNIILLSMFTINEVHMVPDRMFCHFGLLTTQKIKIFKSAWRFYSFTQVHHKCTIIWYGSWDMEHDRQNFCHFGSFLALLLA